MPHIEISADQAAAIEDLQEQLAARFLGAYGIVRPQDALQFLLDYHAADGDLDALDGTVSTVDVADAATGDGASAATEVSQSIGSDDAVSATAEDDGEGAAAEAASSDDDAADPDDRLEEMMNLLSAHEDKWTVSDSDEGGKYVVDLPDGKSMHVRTKDELRATLFRHYR